MSLQGAADAVKDGVQQVANQLQGTTVQDGGEPTANLLLDEVTGEKVSKTELKKRQKLRTKEAAKAEKEATKKPPPPPKKKAGSAEEEEAKLNPNVSLQ